MSNENTASNEICKLQKLVLTQKSLVSTIGLFVRVIFNKLLSTTEKEGCLSGKQFRFRNTKSTLNAVNMVSELAKAAIEEN